MVRPFDIFRLGMDGDVVWVGTSEDMPAAREQIAVLVEEVPADYMIVSLASGTRTIVRHAGDSKLSPQHR